MDESKKYILESSYNPEWLTFEFSLKKLLEISTSPKLCIKPPSKHPEWFKKTKKFQNFFNRSETDSFKEFFTSFYLENKEALEAKLFTASEPVEGAGEAGDTVFTLHDSFFRETSPDLIVNEEIVFPVKDVYNQTIDFHKKCDPDSSESVYPTLFLLYFYGCIFTSVSTDEEGADSKIWENLVEICITAEDESPGSGPAEVPGGQLVSSSGAGPAAGMNIPPMFFDMAKQFGFDMSGAGGAMSSVTNLVSKLMNEMGDITAAPGGDKPELSQILQRFSETLQKPDIKREFDKVASSTTELMNANSETVKKFLPT